MEYIVRVKPEDMGEPSDKVAPITRTLNREVPELAPWTGDGFNGLFDKNKQKYSCHVDPEVNVYRVEEW